MKFLCRLERDEYRFSKLKAGPRVMVSVYSKLYVVSNKVMVKDLHSEDCIAFYPADDTQPLMPRATMVNPDLVITYMDSAKNTGKRRSIWTDLTPNKFMQWLVPIVVISALAYGFLISGGH